MGSLELHRTGCTIVAEPLLGLSEVDREQTILFYQRGTAIELEDAETGAFLIELKERLDAEGGVVTQTAPTGSWPHVFISYAREDRDLASMTFDALQKANFEPWLDIAELRGGELWDERVSDEINAADFTWCCTARRCAARRTATSTRRSHLARERAPVSAAPL